MYQRPNTKSALFWGNLVSTIGYLYLIGTLFAGVVLFLAKDSYCNFITDCSFIEERPYALIGIALFGSGLTFGAPLIAVGKYITAQLEIQNYRLEVSTSA